jgi:iron complex outermembrane receptor protein
MSLTERLTLTANLQGVYNRYAISAEKFLDNEFSLGYFFVNPRIGVNYNLSAEWNAYLSLAYTSREPRMRNLYAAEDAFAGAMPQFPADTGSGRITYDFARPYARPERLTNIELGMGYHATWYRLNANVYIMDFRDELVKSGRIDVFGQSVTGNAEHTLHLGLEIDGSLDLGESLSLSGNFSASRNRHIHYAVFEEGARVSFDGNQIAGFPELLANLRLTYRGGDLMMSASGKFVGRMNTDNTGNELRSNDAWTVCNVDVTYDVPEILGMHISLRGEVNNVFDQLYFMYGEGDAFFPAAERNFLFGLKVAL